MGSVKSTPTMRAVAMTALLLLTACASIERRPVPIEDMDRAVVPGMPDIRDWGDQPSAHFQHDLIQSVRAAWEASGSAPGSQPMHILVLSGGGSNGAFGAGFLTGWTKTGTRPTFKLVTGISTGALIAPFAFLGSDFDPELEEAFTDVRAKDIYTIRSPITVFKKDSLTRTDPLAARIETIVTGDMLQADNGPQHHQRAEKKDRKLDGFHDRSRLTGGTVLNGNSDVETHKEQKG